MQRVECQGYAYVTLCLFDIHKAYIGHVFDIHFSTVGVEIAEPISHTHEKQEQDTNTNKCSVKQLH